MRDKFRCKNIYDICDGWESGTDKDLSTDTEHAEGSRSRRAPPVKLLVNNTLSYLYTSKNSAPGRCSYA